MSEVTLLFPGQGSQYVGMGLALQKEYGALLEQADQVLGYSLTKIMLEGPEADLVLTANTQPAIFTHSLMLYHKLEKFLAQKDATVSRVLGHSVGEYAALAVAGALDFASGVKAVHLRGKFMQEAVPVGVGKMVALLKVPEETAKEACAAVSSKGCEVMPANFNNPMQIVISGHASACDDAVTWLKENFKGSFRATELSVSAPFHSSLMKPAALKLQHEFSSMEVLPTKIPYIANVDAKEYGVGTAARTVVDNLLKQVSEAVLWTQSILQLPEQTVCIECGPGRVLAGLVKKINPNIRVIPLDKDGAWQELEELL